MKRLWLEEICQRCKVSKTIGLIGEESEIIIIMKGEENNIDETPK